MSSSPKGAPASITYDAFTAAFDHFNFELFEGRLPPCRIRVQRGIKSMGYFSGDRFGTDEITLPPMFFRTSPTHESLATLVHEMVHAEQFHFGTPSRAQYHNAEWATAMHRVGLVPSDTGAVGGKTTGQQVRHYVEVGGPFDIACATLLRDGFAFPHRDGVGAPETKAASKTKFSCGGCAANAWAKPSADLVCGACGSVMASA